MRRFNIKKWPPGNYNFIIRSRELNANAVIAEQIKKSKKPTYVFTKEGIIEGEEWLKKIFRKEKYIKIMLNNIIVHEDFDFIIELAFAISPNG